MKTSGVKATDAAIWSGTWSDPRFSGSQGKDNPPASGKAAESAATQQARTDEMAFSQPAEQERQAPADPQVKQLLDMVEDSNDKMKETLQAIKKLKVDTTPVPSAIGMSVNAAANKLKQNDLKVCGMVQEYSQNVPAGHVITQVPGPGSRAVSRSGIRLIISKGPPPEKEKHDVVRQREKVAYLPENDDFETPISPDLGGNGLTTAEAPAVNLTL